MSSSSSLSWSRKYLLWCLLCLPMAAWPGRLPPLSCRPALCVVVLGALIVVIVIVMVIMKIMFVTVEDFSNPFLHGRIIRCWERCCWPVHAERAALLSLPLPLLVARRQDEVRLASLPGRQHHQPDCQHHQHQRQDKVCRIPCSEPWFLSKWFFWKSTFQSWSLSGVNAPHPFIIFYRKKTCGIGVYS